MPITKLTAKQSKSLCTKYFGYYERTHKQRLNAIYEYENSSSFEKECSETESEFDDTDLYKIAQPRNTRIVSFIPLKKCINTMIRNDVTPSAKFIDKVDYTNKTIYTSPFSITIIKNIKQDELVVRTIKL